jgi:hypothetical protein
MMNMFDGRRVHILTNIYRGRKTMPTVMNMFHGRRVPTVRTITLPCKKEDAYCDDHVPRKL